MDDEALQITAEDEIEAAHIIEEMEATPQGQLVLACREGNVDEARHLLESGVKVTSTLFGDSAFSAASGNSRKEIIDLLIEFGFNFKDEEALIHVAKNDHPEMLEFLISRGCDPVEPDDYGWTPLHYSVRHNNLPTAKFLIETVGMDVCLKEPERRTLLMLAALTNEEESGPSSMLKYLIGLNKINVNAQDITGYSALIRSAYWGFYQNTKLLLENAANPNLQVDSGDSALMCCAFAEQSENIRIVCIDGALVGMTRNLYPQIAELLLSHGADKSLRNDDGMRAIDLAHKNGNENIVSLLS